MWRGEVGNENGGGIDLGLPVRVGSYGRGTVVGKIERCKRVVPWRQLSTSMHTTRDIFLGFSLRKEK